MVDPDLARRDERQGQDHDHHRSPCRELASNVTPSEVHGQDQDSRDLRDVLRNRDAHDHIENQPQE
jgi:hypothetical protein